MNSLPNLLKEVIHEKFIVQLVENKFRLEEKKARIFSEIKIPKDADIVCLQFDFSEEVLRDENKIAFDHIFPFFKTGKGGYAGLLTKNDYIIVYQNEDDVSVLLIELKSNSSREYQHQLNTGKIFFEFIINRINLANKSKQEEEIKINTYKTILFKKNGKNPGSNVIPESDGYYRLPYQTYHLRTFF